MPRRRRTARKAIPGTTRLWWHPPAAKNRPSPPQAWRLKTYFGKYRSSALLLFRPLCGLAHRFGLGFGLAGWRFCFGFGGLCLVFGIAKLLGGLGLGFCHGCDGLGGRWSTH